MKKQHAAWWMGPILALGVFGFTLGFFGQGVQAGPTPCPDHNCNQCCDVSCPSGGVSYGHWGRDQFCQIVCHTDPGPCIDGVPCDHFTAICGE